MFYWIDEEGESVIVDYDDDSFSESKYQLIKNELDSYRFLELTSGEIIFDKY